MFRFPETPLSIFKGCRRQPLYCFQIDVFIWLHVTDIYIYNTPIYGCTSMLTFILNVLGEVLDIGQGGSDKGPGIAQYQHLNNCIPDIPIASPYVS